MFRIGEFSKISQTPISQLRYYDEIGLFKADYTDPVSGYRFYRAAQQTQSFMEFPPRQKPASFNLDAVMAKMQQASDGSLH